MARTGHHGRMLPIVLERSFQTWSYGVGHSQLILLARAKESGDEDLVVHFEGIRAMELLSSYQPLVIDVVDEQRRGELMAWAGVPSRLRDGFLYLSVSSGSPRGYVMCGRMTILAMPAGDGAGAISRPPGTRVLHSIRPRDLVDVQPSADTGGLTQQICDGRDSHVGLGEIWETILQNDPARADEDQHQHPG